MYTALRPLYAPYISWLKDIETLKGLHTWKAQKHIQHCQATAPDGQKATRGSASMALGGGAPVVKKEKSVHQLCMHRIS